MSNIKPFNKNTRKITMKNTGDSILHGDVCITKIDGYCPDVSNLKEIDEPIFAYGEHTGHLHMLVERDKLQAMNDDRYVHDIKLIVNNDKKVKGYRLYQLDEDLMICKVTKPIYDLRHQEHDGFVIEIGDYLIGKQKNMTIFNKTLGPLWTNLF